jgi:hypothetical protein
LPAFVLGGFLGGLVFAFKLGYTVGMKQLFDTFTKD